MGSHCSGKKRPTARLDEAESPPSLPCHPEPAEQPARYTGFKRPFSERSSQFARRREEYSGWLQGQRPQEEDFDQEITLRQTQCGPPEWPTEGGVVFAFLAHQIVSCDKVIMPDKPAQPASPVLRRPPSDTQSCEESAALQELDRPVCHAAVTQSEGYADAWGGQIRPEPC